MPYTNTTPPLPFIGSSETSRDAAIKAHDFVGAQGWRVLRFIRWAGEAGATQREIAESLAIGRPSVCARVRALEQMGHVRKTTARRQACAVYQAIT